ncbi:GNAT family N-acetyltransferase [Neobacillus kokaensis]|uniref:Acetyltransferase n=1 Tax=Neobacillus kokaensis TaxID=2759023 RepID=A0ABQ3NA12_9BACI|nr:GNAT family N-acetyltransferase [Neobacillus kokaensis]GHI00759.1 acetyltransferase [Neobacillus kokaensis]
MFEYRILQEKEYGQAIHLANQAFREPDHVSMGEAFPHVFSPALNQSYGAFEDEKLVSFIGLVPSVIHIENAEVQAYSIGAVCTHPDYQKRGLASTLLGHIFAHIKMAGASVLFVSGDLPIYKKAGCTYYGKVLQYNLRQGNLNQKGKYSIRELLPYDWFQIRKLSNKRSVRYEQSIFDLALLNKAAGFSSIFKTKHTILIAEAEGELKAFLVLAAPNLGQPQAVSRVIEWGGDPEAVCSLLAETFRYGSETVRLMVPAFETALIKLLSSLEKSEASYPGTIKIMGLDVFLQQLAPYLAGKITISTIDDQHKQLSWGQNSVIVENNTLEQMILKGIHGLDDGLANIFPVPFPYPEGLNYV